MTTSAPEAEAVLRLSNAHKRFGGVYALRGVDFTVLAGEVHVLLGENGAGKSTLMNVISGAISDYDGEMTVSGRPVRFSSPHAAQRAGIATVFQELDLVPGLTVADNLFLGKEPKHRGPFISKRAMHRNSVVLLQRIGGGVPAGATVGSLGMGQQQLVAIAKALSGDAKILVLDEPTAALPAHEVELLFGLVRRLREQGVGVIFISHRLDEVARIGDRVTVMRDGRVVATVSASTAPERLSQLLTGRATEEMFPPRTKSPGPVRLQVSGFSLSPRRPVAGWRAPADITLTVRAGEVVGLVGLLGAGRTELLQTLYGAGPRGRTTGTVEVDGVPVRSLTIKAALRRGVGFVPDDRRGSGLVATFNVAQNLALSSLKDFSRAGFVRRSRVQDAVAWAFSSFGIKAKAPTSAILSLSGGNQQKVLIGRALMRRPTLLLLDEPTRGIDVGAKADIYRLIRSLTAQGLGVLVASNELLELQGWCDRLVVVREGRAVTELPPNADQPEIDAMLSDPLEDLP